LSDLDEEEEEEEEEDPMSEATETTEEAYMNEGIQIGEDFFAPMNENMYEEEEESTEVLTGDQHELDVVPDGEINANDFKELRKNK